MSSLQWKSIIWRIACKTRGCDRELIRSIELPFSGDFQSTGSLLLPIPRCSLPLSLSALSLPSIDGHALNDHRPSVSEFVGGVNFRFLTLPCVVGSFEVIIQLLAPYLPVRFIKRSPSETKLTKPSVWPTWSVYPKKLTVGFSWNYMKKLCPVLGYF